MRKFILGVVAAGLSVGMAAAFPTGTVGKPQPVGTGNTGGLAKGSALSPKLSGTTVIGPISKPINTKPITAKPAGTTVGGITVIGPVSKPINTKPISTKPVGGTTGSPTGGGTTNPSKPTGGPTTGSPTGGSMSPGKPAGSGWCYSKGWSGWNYQCYWPKYGCQCYWCPTTCCYYYWCETASCYYPISYAQSAPPAGVSPQ
jgi:hypothetical protein